MGGHEEPIKTLDQVVDVAEGASLAAVPEDGHGFPGEALGHEGRDGAAVVQAHAWAVRVEDARDLGVDSVRVAVGHRQRFRESLGFVVHAARSDRVDIAPIGLLLRVHERIAVHLGRRGQEERRPLRLGQTESLVGAERTDLESLDRELEVISRTGRAGEMQDVIHRPLDVDVVRDVQIDETEEWVADVRDIVGAARQQVVDADDLAAAPEKRIAKVGADEPGAAGDQDAARAAGSSSAGTAQT